MSTVGCCEPLWSLLINSQFGCDTYYTPTAQDHIDLKGSAYIAAHCHKTH